MDMSSAIQHMKAPGVEGKSVICIDITNKCDLACSNCTRLLENQVGFWDMTPENFREALRSLQGWEGVIAVIGGNPCMHPKFKELCAIIAEEVPNKAQRGLWTNNFFKHRDISMETFGYFNLNAHDNARGISSIEPIKTANGNFHETYNGGIHEGASRHSPILTAVKDLFPEEEMWQRISECDINQNWSGTIVQNKGELRAYFCEVAASFDLARGTDHGMAVTPGWWQQSMEAFSSQVETFCTGCGVPARLEGNFDYEEIDSFSRSNQDIAENAIRSGRKTIEINSMDEARVSGHKVTQYSSLLRPSERGSRMKRFMRKLNKLRTAWM